VTTTRNERIEADRSLTSGPILLETKLTRPPLRAEHIVRGDLVELMGAGTARPLTVVTAPPGFGKTTLLAAWIDVAAGRVAWLSLDDGDNDPARFFL
jgi:ATP/maltotriose-dependent transcriptional regulator MalT